MKDVMGIDLTDWAALLEALDGVKGDPPPLPAAFDPWRMQIPPLARRPGRRVLRPRYRPGGPSISERQ